MLLENDGKNPPDTHSWHMDLSFQSELPYASVLVAKVIPPVGGNTLWCSCYATYDNLPVGFRNDLENLDAIHNFGDFRSTYTKEVGGNVGSETLNRAVAGLGHTIRPLIDEHPITSRKFFNFNETFVTHIVGPDANESNAVRTYFANHMNKPENHVRWRWRKGDLVV